jgi:deoxyribonuclease-4
MKIGYHISISKGLSEAAKNVIKEKMTAVQIFPGSPRTYFPGKVSDFESFKTLNVPKFVHINYLVNLADSKPVIFKSIAENLKFSEQVESCGLVIHMGSNPNKEQGMKNTVDNINNAIEILGYKPTTKILIETTSEGGNRLKWNDILELKKLMPNIGVCVDTCHLYSAGYSHNQIIEIIEKYNDVIDLIHLNNPSPNVEMGNHKDQHDISLFDVKGKFSNIEIENFISVCNLYKIPMILETGQLKNDFDLIKEKYQNF